MNYQTGGYFIYDDGEGYADKGVIVWHNSESIKISWEDGGVSVYTPTHLSFLEETRCYTYYPPTQLNREDFL